MERDDDGGIFFGKYRLGCCSFILKKDIFTLKKDIFTFYINYIHQSLKAPQNVIS